MGFFTKYFNYLFYYRILASHLHVTFTKTDWGWALNRHQPHPPNKSLNVLALCQKNKTADFACQLIEVSNYLVNYSFGCNFSPLFFGKGVSHVSNTQKGENVNFWGKSHKISLFCKTRFRNTTCLLFFTKLLSMTLKWK